ncbi:MAG: hypothetical protein KDK66_07845, partial [Deltaproteobacteria bacterium]|nr:hypothetical protein [Deltaproteobacteria bacterium]
MSRLFYKYSFLLLFYLFLTGLSACGGGGSPGASGGAGSVTEATTESFETPISNETVSSVLSVNALSVVLDFGSVVSGFTESDVELITESSSLGLPASLNTSVSLLSIETEDNQIYTLLFSIPEGSAGTLQIRIPEGAVEDSQGRPNAQTPVLSFSYDHARPSPVLTSTAGSSTNLSSIPVRVDFGESVTGFDLNDLSVSGASASNLTDLGDGLFSFSLSPEGEGLITLSLGADVAQDESENSNLAASDLTITYDITSPTVSLTSSSASLVNGLIPVTITFSESVVNFDVSDLEPVGGSVSSLSGSGSTYTVNLIPSADGEVSISLSSGLVSDAAGNTNEASNTLSRTYDGTAPTVVLSSSASDPGNISPISLTITFSEAVSSFVVGDIAVSNGSLSNFSTSNNITYTVDITPSADGVIGASLLAGVAEDEAGNASEASNSFSINYDGTGPSVVISSTASDPTSTSPIPITIAFNESVTGLALGDFTIINGNGANLSDLDGQNYT